MVSSTAERTGRRVTPSLLLTPVARAAFRLPVTTALTAMLVLMAGLTRSWRTGPPPGLIKQIGLGPTSLLAGRWWTGVTASLWASGPLTYLGSLLMVVVLLGTVERTIGSRRTVLLAVLVQITGTVAGMGLAAAVIAAGGRWAAMLQSSLAVGPGPLLLGCTLAASARWTALWRRRTRVVVLVVLIMLVLYAGLLSDLLRLGSGLAGLAVGVLWWGRARRRDTPVLGAPSSRREGRLLIALIVAASAIGPLIAVLAETRVGPLAVLRFVFASPPPDPTTVAQLCLDPAATHECALMKARLRLSGVGPAVMSVMPVLLLLVAAEGLRRGRRAAWLAALGLNLALAALGTLLVADTVTEPAAERIVLGPGVHLHAWLTLGPPTLQPLAVAILLVLTRRRFRVAAATGTYRRWSKLLLLTAVTVSVLYVGGSLLVADQYVPVPGLFDLLADLPARFLPPGYLGEIDPPFLPQGELATLLFEWTGPVFWLVVLVAGLATFARTALPAEARDQQRARRILAHTAGGSLAHLITWPGHSYLFLPDGPTRTHPDPVDATLETDGDVAVIAYRVIGGVALTTGGPVGEPAHQEDAIRDFINLCHRHGWTPCLYSVDAAVADFVRGLGWSTVQIAEETVIPLPELVFTGKKWQDIRTALNKAGKAGLTAEWLTWSDAPLALTDQIRAISEEWVADRGLPEMGFTLGGVDELLDDEVRLLLAVDRDRTVHGVTSWLPVRRDGVVIGWTLDFMRRRSNGFRGVMEFLIASAALHAKNDGVEFLSLSGAPLARLDRGVPADTVQRLLDLAGQSLEPLYGFRSLLAFKAKFQPDYHPLFMAYPDQAALPAIGGAVGRAYLPDATPQELARLVRRAVQ
jgi:lysylphosphatidylglycerol synthetase-like protein (DUF2156 family)/membrane associated rhomboid family serine protease